MKSKPIKYFSMFSGIGGFELGMENSNYEFENIGYSEIDKYARSIYEKHYPNHICYGDATQINTKDLPDFEFLVGGFPCQAFSVAGKRKGFADIRGTLFFEIARILKDKRPKHFLLENVKGILSHEGGETIETIFRVCDELGYNVQWAIYNSCDYGVPQNRERIFIKGYSRRECGRKILSVPRVNRTVDEPMSNTFYGTRAGRVHKEDEIMNTLACGGHNGAGSQLIVLNNKKPQAEGIYDSEGLSCSLSSNSGGLGGKTGLYYINEPSLKLKNATKKGYDEATIGDGIRLDFIDSKTGRGRVQKDMVGALNCNPYWGTIDILNSTEKEHISTLDSNYHTVRKLTPVECERLQGFPDGWTELGKDGETISDTQRYKCLGNAVTTNVITAIVNEMFQGDDN